MAQGADSTVHDVVVIGSGAGGGTVTKVLTDMGIRVLLLEAGPMIQMSDFKTMMGPSDFWHRGRRRGGRALHDGPDRRTQLLGQLCGQHRR